MNHGRMIVPIEPTQKMLDAAEELIPWTDGTESRRGFRPIYISELMAP